MHTGRTEKDALHIKLWMSGIHLKKLATNRGGEGTRVGLHEMLAGTGAQTTAQNAISGLLSHQGPALQLPDGVHQKGFHML